MKVTFCDNCEKELMREKKTISLYSPTVFTLTEHPGNSPYSHNIQSSHEEKKNYTKHFCSNRCIGQHYSEFDDLCVCGTHKKGEHCHNISSIKIESESEVKAIAKSLSSMPKRDGMTI